MAIEPSLVEPRRGLTPDQLEKRKRLAREKLEARKHPSAFATRNDLSRHNARIAAEREAHREEVNRVAKAAGMKRRVVRADDGSLEQVWAWDQSYVSMGFEAHQIEAAERFDRDWIIAYSPLKGQSYEPSVDGGSPDAPHIARIQAQRRLNALRIHLGGRDWEIVVAVVRHGATARQVAGGNGRARAEYAIAISAAFNRLDAWYHPTRDNPRKDRTWRSFAELNAERAAIAERVRK
jgi:hypothetical protein